MFKNFLKRVYKEKDIMLSNWKKFTFVSVYLLYGMFGPIKNMVFFLYEPVENDPIIDFFHNNLPEYNDYYIHDVPQIFLWIFTIILFVFIPLVIPKCHENNIYSVKNFIVICMLLAVVFTIRAFCFTMTILPDPSDGCKDMKIDQPKNLFGIFNLFYIKTFLFSLLDFHFFVFLNLKFNF